VEPNGHKRARQRCLDLLVSLGLLAVKEDCVILTDRGEAAQAFGELDLTIEEVRALATRQAT
jgi:hypothetical protein